MIQQFHFWVYTQKTEADTQTDICSQQHYSQKTKYGTNTTSLDKWLNATWYIHAVDTITFQEERLSDTCFNIDEH